MQKAIHVYPQESFLYKVINKSLRENDLTYLDHIGPFCFFIYEFIRYKQMYSLFDYCKNSSEKNENPEKSYSLYRAVNLEKEIIELYDKNKVPYFIWYSFTSTTFNKEMSEQICLKGKMNTIFEIIVEKTIFCPTINIKAYSKYQKEDEILIQAASVLEMVSHKTYKNGINYIVLKLMHNKNLCQNFEIINKQISLLNAEWMWSKEKEWIKYTEEENFLIEYKFQQKEQECELKEHIINFDAMIQYRKENQYQCRVIKREKKANFNEKNVDFSFFKILIDESIGKIYSPLTLYWYGNFILMHKCSYLEKFSVMLEMVYNGIVIEGKLLNKQEEAMKYADELIITAVDKFYSKRAIFEKMVKLYSLQSFIYNSINKALRDNDFSKNSSLGPFCFLFNELISYFDSLRVFAYTGSVYRGMPLARDMVEKNIGNFIYWHAFTSTTKTLDVAEIYAGFEEAEFPCIITIELDSRGVDLKTMTTKEDEDEVLIHAGLLLKVLKFERINEKNKQIRGEAYKLHLTTFF